MVLVIAQLKLVDTNAEVQYRDELVAQAALFLVFGDQPPLSGTHTATPWSLAVLVATSTRAVSFQTRTGAVVSARVRECQSPTGSHAVQPMHAGVTMPVEFEFRGTVLYVYQP
jgi:hypothetical protein